MKISKLKKMDKLNLEETLEKSKKQLDTLRSSQKFKIDSPEEQGIIFTIAETYFDLGRCNEALDYYTELLELKKRKNQPYLASVLQNIANVYIELGNYEIAMKTLNEVLANQKASLTENHEYIGATYMNIGNVYRKMGKCDEALSCYQDSVKIYKRKLPETHPLMKELLDNITVLNQGKNDMNIN